MFFQQIKALLVISCLLVLTACAVSPRSQSIADDSADPLASSLERVRYSELSAWSLLADGSLWIELNNPIRTYRLALRPSCTFALREALTIGFNGMSPDFIALGDRVIVGRNQCEIVGIYETDDGRAARVSVEKGQD